MGHLPTNLERSNHTHMRASPGSPATENQTNRFACKVTRETRKVRLRVRFFAGKHTLVKIDRLLRGASRKDTRLAANVIMVADPRAPIEPFGRMSELRVVRIQWIHQHQRLGNLYQAGAREGNKGAGKGIKDTIRTYPCKRYQQGAANTPRFLVLTISTQNCCASVSVSARDLCWDSMGGSTSIINAYMELLGSI